MHCNKNFKHDFNTFTPTVPISLPSKSCINEISRLFAEYIFAGNSDGNFKFAGNLPAKTANFLLCEMYHTKL